VRKRFDDPRPLQVGLRPGTRRATGDRHSSGNGVPFSRFLLRRGHIGVDIFFVLSGFLITTLLIQEFDESGSISLSNFYIRRVPRLGPALIAFLIVFCLASFAFLSGETAHRNYVDAFLSFAYIQNFALSYSIRGPYFI
jgi:peptidoglycan/LPS O-acetylase OafA/YrhL